jgi:hypothetical protein
MDGGQGDNDQNQYGEENDGGNYGIDPNQQVNDNFLGGD